MTRSALRRARIAGALAMMTALAAATAAQGLYYREVEKDGRIYVFSSGKRYEAWSKSGEMGEAIMRPGFGPDGETVVFDGEDAVNLYNYKHDKPGESFEKAAEAPKPPHPSGRIIGLVFGDFYYFADHHEAKFDGQQGFWLRRAYLGWDQSFSDKLSARLRLEMNSNGQLAGGNLTPFVKDAYLAFKYGGKHQARLGIQPSLTFEAEESLWGLRHIEKTPADLYRIDSSRDFAIAFTGPIGGQGLSYAAQFGNESGNGSETDEYKIVRFRGLFEAKSGLRIEGVFNFADRADDQDRTTAKGAIGYKGKGFRVAAEYLWQKRKSGRAATPDQQIDLWSGFGAWDLARKASVFARLDRVKGKLGGAETGLPGADGIDYLSISTGSPFKTWIFGFEWQLASSVRFSPNMEWIDYDDASSGRIVVARLTFYWTW